MATRQDKDGGITVATGGMKRRGLIAGAAALVVGMTMKDVAQADHVSATDFTPLIVGQPNSSSLQTTLTGAYQFGSNAMFQVSNSTGGSSGGISGQTSGTGNGVAGYSQFGIGVYGVSGGGVYPYGIAGGVASAPGFALYGVAGVANTVGFAAGAGAFGAIAGQFSGPVNIYPNGGIAPGNLFIQGNYTATGFKSAAVPHPDGSHRLLYCMESPEAWFEDFGKGTLTAGKAEIKLDPDFAAVVDTSTLHVFPVSHDEHHALHIAGTSTTGFTVGAVPSSTGTAAGKTATDLSGTFSYRVVAKRKDVKAERLAKFDVPQEIKLPAPPLPSMPVKPKQ